jgi:hypothetical protein
MSKGPDLTDPEAEPHAIALEHLAERSDHVLPPSPDRVAKPRPFRADSLCSDVLKGAVVGGTLRRVVVGVVVSLGADRPVLPFDVVPDLDVIRPPRDARYVPR